MLSIQLSPRFRRRPWWFTLVLTLLITSNDGVSATYSGNSGNYNSNYNAYYNSQQCPTPLSLCDDSVVQVSRINWYCNSPYAYYWGSGTHRNAKICAYNDKLTYEITVKVTDDIYDVDDISVSIAVQDSKTTNILQTNAPQYLCRSFIGAQCTSKGQYSFSFTIQLRSSSTSSSSYYPVAGGSGSEDFCPTLIMAFSSQEDSGYNLGALNMQCQSWDNSFATWAKEQTWTARDYLRNYGMIMGTGLALLVFASFVWLQARRVTTFGSCGDPCMVELDQYYSAYGGYPPPDTIPSGVSMNRSNHSAYHLPHAPSSPRSTRTPTQSYNSSYQNPTTPARPPYPNTPQRR